MIRVILFSLHLFRASFGVPCFLFFLGLQAGVFINDAQAVEDVAVSIAAGGDFRAAHDALVETVEGEGMVIGAVLPFGEMLTRTAVGRDHPSSPYAQAEIVQFCSSAIAWQMVSENPSQIALCPMSVAVYTLVDKPDSVMLAYRLPGVSSPARAKAGALLERLVRRAAELARRAW